MSARGISPDRALAEYLVGALEEIRSAASKASPNAEQIEVALDRINTVLDRIPIQDRPPAAR